MTALLSFFRGAWLKVLAVGAALAAFAGLIWSRDRAVRRGVEAEHKAAASEAETDLHRRIDAARGRLDERQRQERAAAEKKIAEGKRDWFEGGW